MTILVLLKQSLQAIHRRQMAGQQRPRRTLQDKATDKLNAIAFQQLAYRCCLSCVVPVRTNKQQINKRDVCLCGSYDYNHVRNSTNKPQAKCVCY